ncbi:MAG: hypothetical protein L6455_14620 [Kiritimatiellae bacterium]|nr:hypothetical protein [Kiritimatiellia bacterium]
MNDRCDPVFFNCWSHLIAGGMRTGDTVLDAGIELPQHFAAVVLASYFLKSNADTLLMVDTDMVFKSDTLNRLRDDVEGQEYDMLSALSVTRRRPFHPIILRLRDKPLPNGCAYECIKPKPEDTILESDSVGTGFTLIRRALFNRMRSELGITKWFFDWMPGGGGEDTMFCQNAKRLGAKIGVHTRVNIGHRGPITFIWDAEQQRSAMETNDQIAAILSQ